MSPAAAGTATAFVLAAALPLLRGGVGQRGFAAFLLALVAILALRWPGAAPWLDGATVADASVAAQLVMAAAGGTALLAAARRIDQAPWLLRVPVLPTGLTITLAQLVLFHAAATTTAGPVRPEMVMLWVVGLGWALGATGLMFATLHRYRAFLARRARRVGSDLVAAGLLLSATAQLGAAGQGVAGLLGGASTWLAGLVDYAVGGAGILISCGLLAPRVEIWIGPALRWGRALRALNRLRWLYSAVVLPGAPEWTVPPGELRGLPLLRGARGGEARLYGRIIAIRDASWALLAVLSDADIAAAVRFATSACSPPTNRRIAAAAEACMLAAAMDAYRAPAGMPAEGTNTYRTRSPDEPLGSVVEEAEFLILVAETWRQWSRTGALARFLEETRARGGLT